MSNTELSNFNRQEKTSSNSDLNTLIKDCHNAFFNDFSKEKLDKKVTENTAFVDSAQMAEKDFVRVIVKDKFRKVVSENDIHKLEVLGSGDFEVKRSRELEDLYQDCEGNTFIDEEKNEKLEKSKNLEFLLKNRKASRCAESYTSNFNNNFKDDLEPDTNNAFEIAKKTTKILEENTVNQLNCKFDFLNDFSVNKNKTFGILNVDYTDKEGKNSFVDQRCLEDEYNNLSLRENTTLSSVTGNPIPEDTNNNDFCSSENKIPSFILSFINNTLLSNKDKTHTQLTEKIDLYKISDDKYLSNQQKLEILMTIYAKLNPEMQSLNPLNTVNDLELKEKNEQDTATLSYLNWIMKLESLTSNINSDVINSGKIIKAYKSKLKSKNWNSYLINSKLTEMKNKYKFYHKCNFPSCNRTFSSSGWLKTHIEEHMREIHSDEFNKDFEKYKYANKIKYIF